jgi:hypothetical protein
VARNGVCLFLIKYETQRVFFFFFGYLMLVVVIVGHGRT